MKKTFSILFGMWFLLILTGVANATLVTIGTTQFGGSGPAYNLVYDADGPTGPITWLDYSNNGAWWKDQKAWSATIGPYQEVDLNDGYTSTIDWKIGWRLPSKVEMEHLFNTELTYGQNSQGNTIVNSEEFNNLIETNYWSGTKMDSYPGFAYYYDIPRRRLGAAILNLASYPVIGILSCSNIKPIRCSQLLKKRYLVSVVKS